MCQVVFRQTSKGDIVSYFQCAQVRLPNGELESMEERWARGEAEAQMVEMERDEMRRRTKLFDPDRRFKARNEMREKGVQNLGRSVNRIPETAIHF